MVVLLRDGWEVRLLRTSVPNSPAPRTRIEEGAIVVAGECFGTKACNVLSIVFCRAEGRNSRQCPHMQLTWKLDYCNSA